MDALGAKLAKALNVRGLMNMQLAVKGDDLMPERGLPQGPHVGKLLDKLRKTRTNAEFLLSLMTQRVF